MLTVVFSAADRNKCFERLILSYMYSSVVQFIGTLTAMMNTQKSKRVTKRFCELS